MDVTSLKWLEGDRIESAKYDTDSQSWLVSFKSGSTLNIECIWRLLEEGIICSTSESHGHQFGMAKPFDGEAALNEMAAYEIKAVKVTPGVGDIYISIGELFELQVMVTYVGYESWQAKSSKGNSVVAVSGQLDEY